MKTFNKMNSYRRNLELFHNKALYYRHIISRVIKILQEDKVKYTSESATFHSISALAISDWTGPTENGWEINFYTGNIVETTKEEYIKEIDKMISKQLCLFYAQIYEAFEKFVKDCLYERTENDINIRTYAISLLTVNMKPGFSRAYMPTGKKLYELLKKAGGKTFEEFNSTNSLNIKFPIIWTIFAEVRHSITHKESIMDLKIIKKSKEHTQVFNMFFNMKPESSNTILIQLDIRKFNTLIKRFSEYAFQIYKILSIEEGLEWKIDDTHHKTV